MYALRATLATLLPLSIHPKVAVYNPWLRIQVFVESNQLDSFFHSPSNWLLWAEV